MKIRFIFISLKKKTVAFFLEKTKHQQYQKKKQQHWEWSLNVLSCHKIVSCTYFCCYSAIYLVGVYFIFMSDDIFFFFLSSFLVFVVIEFIWILHKIFFSFYCCLLNWATLFLGNFVHIFIKLIVKNWATIFEIKKF